jgi:hypothetical protein
MDLKKVFPYFSAFIFFTVAVFISVLFIQKKTSLPTRAGEEKAQLWLLPTQEKLKKGEESEVRVLLISRVNEVGGVDLILKYNPNLLEIVGNTIKPGTIFDYYRGRLVDNRRGVVRLSSSGKFIGEGTFATFKIKGIENGKGKIEIVDSKTSVDSTVVWDKEEKTNILGNTYNLSFEVY